MDHIVTSGRCDLARFRLGIHARMFAKAVSRQGEGLHVQVEKEDGGLRIVVSCFRGGVEVVQA